MLKSFKIWNEPNNVSHVLGGMSPIDARFLRGLESRGGLGGIDVLAVRGFPLDWNLWPMEHPVSERGEHERDGRIHGGRAARLIGASGET